MKKPFILVLILTTFSCQNQRSVIDRKEIIIDFVSVTKNKIELKLSDISIENQFIKLETHNKSYVNNISSFCIKDEWANLNFQHQRRID